MTKFESLLEDFKEATIRLEEILREEKSDVVRDSAIKRFEITFDLSWKTLKALLEEKHGVNCASPRNCFKEAFRVGIIDYEEDLIGLISDRNYTAHVYREALANKIYEKLPASLLLFKKLLESITRTVDN